GETRLQQVRHAVNVKGWAKEKSLRRLARQLSEKGKLFRVLDAFDDEIQPQLLRHPGQSADERGGVVVPLDVANERAVDLERVHGQLAEVGKRGIACAEIVNADPDAHGAQLHQHALGRGWIVDGDAFGQLEHQASPVERSLPQG